MNPKISCFLVAAFAVGSRGQRLPETTLATDRFALTYDHSLSLDDIGDILDKSGAQVVQQLTCTRGLVVLADEGGREALGAVDGVTVLPLPDASHGNRAPSRDLQSCQYRRVCRDDRPPPRLFSEDVDYIKEYIRDDLASDSRSFDGSSADSMGALLRLLFHDAASFNRNDSRSLSGLNGCTNARNTGNAGLQNAQRFLMRLKSDLQRYDVYISMADLTVLGAIAAIEEGISNARDAGNEYGSFSYEFRYGRPDIGCQCEDDFLPPSESRGRFSHEVLDDTMGRTMGFSRREITALMGSHTLGRTVSANSGYHGPFVGNGRNKEFNNFYYRFVLGGSWRKQEKSVNGARLTEWQGPSGRSSILLNSDAALAFDIEEHSCTRFGDLAMPSTCRPLRNEYGMYFRRYADNNDLWMEDYSMAFRKMADGLVPCQRRLLRPQGYYS